MSHQHFYKKYFPDDVKNYLQLNKRQWVRVMVQLSEMNAALAED